ncbi:MAG: dienelactone hydrolase, partial [Cyclobacteriaceae bacterium]|nr:dienelactone hydrolase [Cyclobacteriaceae bacterium]
MKKPILLVLLHISVIGFAQKDISVCHTSATDKFAVFASNKKFNSDHPSPLLYVHKNQAGGKMIKIKCADGIEANAYLIESKSNTNNWVFVFQEWWGLNDHIKR